MMLQAQLPVSGIPVLLREPAGDDELLFAEAALPDLGLALALAARLVSAQTGAALDWSALPVMDLDFVLLSLRQWLLGDTIRADVACAGRDCGARVDVTFRISDYVAHHRPQRVRGLRQGDEPGWFRLEGLHASFRLPSAGDQLAVHAASDPLAVLSARCIRDAPRAARERRRLEAAMAALAPGLDDDVEVKDCPVCGATFLAPFDPQHYVLRELRAWARDCYSDVARIAACFHWSEAEILRLPRRRRARYAELAERQAVGA